jgi:uncharacterized membrane protein
MPCSADCLVPALALAAAICSAAAAIFIRQGLRGSHPYTGFWISLVVGTVGLWTGVLLTGDVRVSTSGMVLFALAGLIGTVGGRLARFIAIEKVGASVGAAVMNLQPLIASGLAILLLGEHVTTTIAAGTVVIVLGTVLLSLGGRSIGFRPWQIVIPLISATCFGVVAILRKIGLAGTGAVIGTAINLTTALVIFTAFLLLTGRRESMGCRGRNLAYFIAAGVADNGGVFMTVVALTMGSVSVVTPLTASAPLFVLLFAPFLLRGVESLTARIVIGTLMVVLGVYLITALS